MGAGGKEGAKGGKGKGAVSLLIVLPGLTFDVLEPLFHMVVISFGHCTKDAVPDAGHRSEVALKLGVVEVVVRRTIIEEEKSGGVPGKVKTAVFFSSFPITEEKPSPNHIHVELEEHDRHNNA